ncbi:MAG TPA: hypothetical protein VGG39_22650 [Polyangiaceae bacterium]|jgi:hypothetical protein
MASRLLFASMIAIALAASSVAMAEPTAADKETARGLMTEGRADRDKGDLKGALKAFQGADALMHVPTTGLEVAKTQMAMGLLVEARDTALRVSRSQGGADEPAPFKQARDAASSLNDEIEARIPAVTVTLKNVPDGVTAAVTIDGAPVPSAALGEPRKMNPGHHVIVAKGGGVEAKAEVDLAEKDHKDVPLELPAGAQAGVAAAGTTDGAAAGGSTDTAPAADTGVAGGKSGFSKGLVFGGFGLAGAGLIAGTITGVLSMSKTNSIKSSPLCASGGGSTQCGPGENSDISSAKSMATLSTVSFIVAGAGGVIGVIGLLTGNHSGGSEPAAAPASPPSDDTSGGTDQSSSRLELHPWFGLGSAGLTGTF